MISVCLASYNGGRYIKLQIESILNQLAEGDELIISDDNSTDNTVEIIKSIGDERIKLVFNNNKFICKSKYKSSNHYKVTTNFHNALRLAKGDFIFLSDQDDVWMHNKVSICIDLLDKYNLVMTNCKIIDENGKDIDELKWNTNPIKGLFVNFINMPFHGCCIALDKKLLQKILPLPSNLIMHDNWIGMVAKLSSKIVYIDTPYVLYRRHSSNVSGESGNSLFFKLNYRLVFLFQLIFRCLKLNK